MKTGIALFAHGSRIADANEQVRATAGRLRERREFGLVEAAFLELGEPDLAGAVNHLIGLGAEHIVVVPYFLAPGIHLARDLPRIVEGIRGIHKGIRIDVAAPLDGHPALIEAVLDRAQEAAAGKDVPPEGETG